jgi:hypothetical protein
MAYDLIIRFSALTSENNVGISILTINVTYFILIVNKYLLWYLVQ